MAGCPGRAAAIAFHLLLCVRAAGGMGSTASPYVFDMSRRHESISVHDAGAVALKEFGEDYQSVLLRPALAPGSRSYVEFLIEQQAAPQVWKRPSPSPATPGCLSLLRTLKPEGGPGR